VCIPFGNKSEKCVVYMFSDFNYGTQGNILIMNNYFQDKIRLLRMNILASFIETQRFEIERQMKDIYYIESKGEQHNDNGYPDGDAGDDDNDREQRMAH
jgi:hypothetical protein